MKVYIVGAGAVGTYLGDLLQSVNVEVTYAPRDLAAVTPVDADVAIVAVKAYDTGGAIETLRKAIAYPQKCVFVSPQMGHQMGCEPFANLTGNDKLHFEAIKSVNHGFWEWTGRGRKAPASRVARARTTATAMSAPSTVTFWPRYPTRAGPPRKAQ